MFGAINRVFRNKELWETKYKFYKAVIQPNSNNPDKDKEANLARARKMELAFQVTKNLYDKKSTSINVKLRQFITMPSLYQSYEASNIHI